MKSNPFLLLCFLLLLPLASASAQDFKWQAQLTPVPQPGYYRVLLSPQITGHLQESLADIRLVNREKQAVPYLLRVEQPVQYQTLFKEYEILRYQRRPGGMSELLIHNPEQRTLNNISLLIGNAETRKTVSLSGSDNQQDWFVLKEQDVLYAIENTQKTTEVKLLDFPLSNYRYFRLQLQDSASAPLNILKAGYYDTYSEAGKYTRIPVQTLSRTDSAKTTLLRLRFGQPVYPEQLVFHISAPHLYHRAGRVVLGKKEASARVRKKRRRQQIEQTTVPLLLSSNTPATLHLPRQRVEELVVQIDNGDSPPLRIDSLQVLQLNRYLVAEMAPDQQYSLRFGSEKLDAPDYDLMYFQDSIPRELPLVHVQSLQRLKTDIKVGKTKGSKILIWVAIAVLAAGLGLMSIKLLREMEKKK
ncbi:hypothetical protein [Rufibacter quisquiliarum]|uniref:DUF3999 domain-containing protein n=1 Tax=Rufibacter quisquiliarum TaxID=1549639 RepID=A0A839GAG3_9BACT|nr:hypothetical protein [Rufibacter quisquiliarum]MBA9076514.1 hypothetical protein [Rufibacter quisquiliarum]